MASEPSEESTLTVSLPSELEEWLDARAREHGLDRETVLVGLLSTYREAAAIDESAGLDALAAAVADSDPVREALADAAEDAVGEVDATEDLDDRLADEVEAVRSEFQGKLDDVRERVIQVKREADAKAAADHTHEELARADALGERVLDLEKSIADLDADLSDLEATVDRLSEETAGVDEDVTDTVEELQDRLKTVAWVVSDLREAYEGHSGSATLEKVKRTAAEADAARAKCERCGEGVDVALLTSPECPHCGAAVTEVTPASGFFGKPTLRAASQLESGDER